jgi:hypothetical protein
MLLVPTDPILLVELPKLDVDAPNPEPPPKPVDAGGVEPNPPEVPKPFEDPNPPDEGEPNVVAPLEGAAVEVVVVP